MLGDLERQRCQRVTLRALRKKRDKSVLQNLKKKKKGKEPMNWGEGAVSERNPERKVCSAELQSLQIILLPKHKQRDSPFSVVHKLLTT